MQVGDVLHIRPNFYTEYMGGNDGPRPARVVYIHPLERFFRGGVPERPGHPLAGDVFPIHTADRGHCGPVRTLSAA